MWLPDELLYEPAESDPMGFEPAGFEPMGFDAQHAVDTDGDGLVDTLVVPDGDALTVVYDLDGDGHADRQVDFDPSGGYRSWELRTAEHGVPRWELVDRGSLDD